MAVALGGGTQHIVSTPICYAIPKLCATARR
jgi:hypothetical protein